MLQHASRGTDMVAVGGVREGAVAGGLGRARRAPLLAVLVAVSACRSEPSERPGPGGTSETQVGSTSGSTSTPVAAPLSLASVDPAIADPIGGSRLVLSGSGFASGSVAVSVGGEPASDVVVLSDTELEVITPPLPVGDVVDVTVSRDVDVATLAEAVEIWSPASIPGARLFDAASGVAVEEPATQYEWQRLTPEISPDWRVRDGNTLNWLPATGRFWMVGGWNGYQEPVGFSTVPPDLVYPPENTSDEVWSSPDGVTWTLELPHLHGQFERRHSHNTVLWNDRLWMVGGDTHQGYYNHDVVSSADGVNWTVELGPGTTEPPWSERALGTLGVHDGKLWMAGGQDLLGLPEEYAYHNDVWSTEDGVNWTQVVADAPASDTRWAGCGAVDGLVSFRGELWLVGCARYRDDVGHTMFAEVWSTTDGAVWTKHADPPWAGKIWHNVVVWDDKLWALFGYTLGDPANGWPAGNANEVWYSEDGETWASLTPDAPAPGSHAQGVAVHEDFLLYAGGNYSYGFGAGEDKSAWRLVPFRGEAARSWTDRGEGGLVVSAADDEARPALVPDAFGPGVPGLHFDGSRDFFALDAPEGDVQADGRSVFWVARAPYLPPPWDWIESYAPLGTIVGGPVAYGWMPTSSVGLSGGQVVLVNLDPELGVYGEPLWSRLAAGAGLQEGPGEVHVAGITHAADGSLATWVDGALVGDATASYDTPRAWSRIGSGMDDAYYGPNTRFAGTLGAVVVTPGAVDADTVARLQAWARGRFRLASRAAEPG